MRIIGTIGNTELWKRDKTLFLSSKRVPYTLYSNIFAWVDSLTKRDCVMCCNSSELETEVMKSLVENSVPTILVVMNKFRDGNNVQIKNALKKGCILIVILERDEPRKYGLTPRLRNEFLMKYAHNVVCGYVSSWGSIRPLVKDNPAITYLDREHPTIASEPDEHPMRWSVAEDKALLRMFYNDHSIHFIHKNINRGYLPIRNRIKSITMSEDVLKGREFEDFVLELFNVHSDGDLVLKEWRGDKSLGEVFPESNRDPDFLFEHEGRGIAAECKWRNRINLKILDEMLLDDQIKVYKDYGKRKKVPVVIVLGIGGEPCAPEEVFVIPIDSVDLILSKSIPIGKFRLERYKTAPVNIIKYIEGFEPDNSQIKS